MAVVVERALHELRPRALEKGIAVSFENLAGDARILADTFRIRQVVLHLLSNALQVTPTARGIAVELTRDRESLRLAVHDAGPEIPSPVPVPASGEHRRPVRLSGPPDERSIRLHVVRRLVEVHQGRLVAASGGKCGGTVITMELPFCHDERAPRGPDETSSIRGKARGIRALVVDDDMDARDLLGAFLRSKGALVAVASKVSTALGLFDVWQPDIVFTDISLPEHDGNALAHDLRGRYPTLPIVALSGLAGAHGASYLLTAGFDSFLPKPIQLVDLLDVLERVVPRGSHETRT
jgi:CheY-like chemotaxis protein